MSEPESLLGRTASGPIDYTEIEVWPLVRSSSTSFSTTEFQALCPVTGQPDLYSVEISYWGPATFESKGLKHYLWSFRDRGIGAETLAITLADELGEQIGFQVSVKVVQQVRGGLSLTSVATSGQRKFNLGVHQT